jgi:hypothetical protein
LDNEKKENKEKIEKKLTEGAFINRRTRCSFQYIWQNKLKIFVTNLLIIIKRKRERTVQNRRNFIEFVKSCATCQ